MTVFKPIVVPNNTVHMVARLSTEFSHFRKKFNFVIFGSCHNFRIELNRASFENIIY